MDVLNLNSNDKPLHTKNYSEQIPSYQSIYIFSRDILSFIYIATIDILFNKLPSISNKVD